MIHFFSGLLFVFSDKTTVVNAGAHAGTFFIIHNFDSITQEVFFLPPLLLLPPSALLGKSNEKIIKC